MSFNCEKNRLTIILFILFTAIDGINQKNFTYDSAGNRVSWTIDLGAIQTTMNGGENEKFSFEKSEDFFTEVLAKQARFILIYSITLVEAQD